MTQAVTNNTSRRRLLALGLFGGVGVIAGLQYMRLGQTGADGPVLSVTDAHKSALDQSVTLIDIRRPDEWSLTGIGQGAHAIDMRRDDFVEALGAIVGDDRSAPVALICARGVRSARLARRLSDAGFTRIIDVPEGMLGSAAGPGWLARGLPVTAFEGGQG